MTIRRRLAQDKPDIVRLPLILSLEAHGDVLLELGRGEEAAQAFQEGLQTLLPFLRTNPNALLGAVG